MTGVGLFPRRNRRFDLQALQASPVNVRGFWAYVGYREAQNQARRRFGQGDCAAATDRAAMVESARRPKTPTSYRSKAARNRIATDVVSIGLNPIPSRWLGSPPSTVL